MFTLESNKNSLRIRVLIYTGITLFIALFGAVYEQFSHNVHTAYMWFAWAWVLGFGLIPYLLLYLLPIKKMPGQITECVYNLGVAMITVRSIYIGVILIYNTTGDNMVLAYTIVAIVCLVGGLLLYTIGLLLNRKAKSE